MMNCLLFSNAAAES